MTRVLVMLRAINFLFSGRYKIHATFWTHTRLVLHNLGMHGASVRRSFDYALGLMGVATSVNADVAFFVVIVFIHIIFSFVPIDRPLRFLQ